MPDEISAGCTVKRNEDQRDNNDGEYGMSCQNYEIDRPNNPLPREARGAMKIVIGKVGSQKKRRRDDGRDLAISMGLDSTKANKPESLQQQESARRVQNRVQVGKE